MLRLDAAFARPAARQHRLATRAQLRQVGVLHHAAHPYTDATIHGTDALTAADVCIVDGIPTTSRSRTLLDLGAVVPFEVVEHVAQVAIIERLVTEASGWTHHS